MSTSGCFGSRQSLGTDHFTHKGVLIHMQASLFKRIILPGFLLQSVIIGGGYATGRELVEFFLSQGPMAGLFGLLVATLLFSIIAALCFEFARRTSSYNYRAFFRALLGRWWFLYELAFLILCLLILAVIGAASGEMVAARLGLPSLAGTGFLMLLIGVLVFHGTAAIERVLAGWSFLLYATYALFVAWYLWTFSSDLDFSAAAPQAGTGWLSQGIKYVGYNIAALPVILFCVQHMNSRRDAVAAGLLAGPLAMIPGILFFLAMAASYPGVLDAPVPADYMMQRLGVSWLQVLFYIVVFGTFVETGAANIHAINERINDLYHQNGRDMPTWLRPAVAISTLSIAIVLAETIGLINLIANGYGTLTWAFILVFIVPLCTYGVWRMARV